MTDVSLAAPNAGPIACVVGARPNFMKMAPILRAFAALDPPVATLLVHTGQHYDTDMNDRLFADLGLPRPDVNLKVGSGSHAVQTAQVMLRFEAVLDEHRPRCVVVVGDVNSTLACTLVAVKKNVPVVHVEAGLRSHDRQMPEEINRKLCDQVADRLYTTERSAGDNLLREGIDASRICFAGNVMIDSLFAARPKAPSPQTVLQTVPDVPARWHEELGRFGVVTLHRPSNVDSPDVLRHLLQTLALAAQRLPLVFALHPRTRANIKRFDLQAELDPDRILLLPPQGYLEMLGLMSAATVLLTDSGGLQEESTALGVPCLTLRDNTERPITLEQGTNSLVGQDRELTLSLLDQILSGAGKRGRAPERWDGHAATRIAEDLMRWLTSQAV